ncbi:MAG TPA: hypothetical protein P5555_14945 [Candidatus Paceibacterota bacterium]|nr:hypothetical protein [Candidatus Paceibacterota bacterium]
MALNPFEQLKNVCVEPRQAFEEICTDILRRVVPGSRRIRVHGGDEGVDSFLGEWGPSGGIEVYQTKFFPDQWSTSQQQQIVKSFERARDSKMYHLTKWFLCVPARLTKNDLRWFDVWREKQAVAIELLDGDDLTERLSRSECREVRLRLIEWGVQGLPRQDRVVFGPGIQLRCISNPRDGICCVCTVFVKNGGNLSARNMRVVIRHSETNCVCFAADQSLWAPGSDGVLNPRTLEAKKPLHPGEEVLALRIPLQRIPTTRFFVEVKISADDCPVEEYRANIIPEQWEEQAVIQLVPRGKEAKDTAGSDGSVKTS